MSVQLHDQVEHKQEQETLGPTYEERMFWRIRWFFAAVLLVGYLTSNITAIVGFSLTRDPHFLTFISSILITPVMYYLVPMDEKRYHLKALKIQVKAQSKIQELASKQQNKKHVSD